MSILQFLVSIIFFWPKLIWIHMSVTMTNHLVIWNQTYLERISRESLKTEFMSRRNIFQFWYLIIYLRLTHTILCLNHIHNNILEQFDTLGDGITVISWIWDHKWIMSRRNVAAWLHVTAWRKKLKILKVFYLILLIAT